MMIALVFQDAKSGVEVKNRETWGFLDAASMKSVFYLNIGDTFMRVSNSEIAVCYWMIRKHPIMPLLGCFSLC